MSKGKGYHPGVPFVSGNPDAAQVARGSRAFAQVREIHKELERPRRRKPAAKIPLAMRGAKHIGVLMP